MEKTIKTLTSVIIILLIPGLVFAWQGEVVHISDGDTIKVIHNGQRIKIRLYGIDTPEKTQWYGQNAKEFLSGQILGETVEVEEIGKDRYGRTVALISAGGQNINRLMVEAGYAWVYDRYCKQRFCRIWKEVEKDAREAGKGLWKNKDVIPPWQYRRTKNGWSR